MLVIILFVVILTLTYYYFTANFSHWKDKGIKSLNAYPLVGSMGRVMTLKEHMSAFFLDAYEKYRDEPYTGYFQVIKLINYILTQKAL